MTGFTHDTKRHYFLNHSVLCKLQVGWLYTICYVKSDNIMAYAMYECGFGAIMTGSAQLPTLNMYASGGLCITSHQYCIKYQQNGWNHFTIEHPQIQVVFSSLKPSVSQLGLLKMCEHSGNWTQHRVTKVEKHRLKPFNCLNIVFAWMHS